MSWPRKKRLNESETSWMSNEMPTYLCQKCAGSVTSTLIPVYFGWYWRGLASIVIRDGRHVEKWFFVLWSDERGSSDVLHSSDRMHSPSRLPTRSSVENDLRIVVSYSSLECLFAHCRCVWRSCVFKYYKKVNKHVKRILDPFLNV